MTKLLIKGITLLLHSEGRLFSNYVAVAGLAAIVDYSLLVMFTAKVGIWYWLSAALSYSVGMIVNYTLNKWMNFRNPSKKLVQQFSLFVTIALMGLVLNQLVLFLSVEFAGVHYMIAKLAALGVVGIWSYWGHSRITFKWLR